MSVAVYSVAQTTHKQEAPSHKRFAHKLGSTFDYGFVIPTNEYLRGDYEGGEAVSNYWSLSAFVTWQTQGDKLWHQLYGNPGWGLGLYHADFGRPDDLGAPWAVFGFYEGPFKRWDKVSVNYHFRVGYSVGWNPFDPDDNPYQISLGSSKAGYANLRIYLQYKLSPHIELDAGASITHFSNGATVKPNKGINMISPSIGLYYQFHPEEQPIARAEIPEYKDHWEWNAVFNFGQKQVAFDTTNSPKEIDRRYVGVNFNIYGISTTIYRQFTHKSKFGAGIDFLYDESMNATIDPENGYAVEVSSNLSDKLAIGIFPAYELVVDKLSFYVQGGYYIIRKKRYNEIPAFYQRVGMKYHVFKNVSVGINIKAYNMQVADFIEWNLGYRIKWPS